MVTGASGMIGRTLVPLLIRNDEVRACVRRPEAAPSLRAMGAKVAVGHLDDADALAEILKRVFTVIHLVGGPTQGDDDAVLAANHGSVITALAASREAGVSRFVLLSATGAAVDASNRYLRAKGLAEEAVANSGLEHAIVRSTHAYGLGGSWLAVTVALGLCVPLVWSWPRDKAIALLAVVTVIGSWAPLVALALRARIPILARLKGAVFFSSADVVGVALPVAVVCLYLAMKEYRVGR